MTKTVETMKTAPLIVENGNWGAVSLSEIYGVLESAYAALEGVFEKEREHVIHVAPWNREYPLVVYDRRPYQIFLCTRDRDWSQYVYQFSHELCHTLTNFDRIQQHKHKWFEESLCELSSLFVLHRLAEIWVESPPTSVFKAADFAPNHKEYAESIEAKYSISSSEDISGWLAENIHTLETSSEERELNGVVAVALLNHFRKNPSLWSECGWLNHWDPREDNSFPEYLDSWSECLKANGINNRVPNIAKGLLCRGGKEKNGTNSHR